MTTISYHQLPFASGSGTYQLTRKAVKNVNLRIRADGTIYVSAPFFVSQMQIDEFLCREEAFIRQTLANIKKTPALQLRTGETLCLNGKPCTLVVTESPAERMYQRKDTIYLETMFAADKEEYSGFARRSAIYHRFLLQEAGPLFKDSIARIYPLVRPYGVPMPAFTIRRMKTRWGSCTPARGTIRLNSYLAVMPDSCIDQVVLHEFCHFFECNHSSRFYNWMNRLMPDWKQRREAIRQYIPYCI